jgi:hypothetical protein
MKLRLLALSGLHFLESSRWAQLGPATVGHTPRATPMALQELTAASVVTSLNYLFSADANFSKEN